MTSIYEQALKAEFQNLHPMLQKKFTLHSSTMNMANGEGQMVKMTGGRFWFRPFLRFLTKEHLLFPERGEHVPFTIENYAYKDHQGQEMVSWIRRFHFPKVTRAFDAVMRFDDELEVILDDLGTSGRLTSPLHLSVNDGGLVISTNEVSLHLLKKQLKLPAFSCPRVKVYENFDEELDQFIIHVSIYQPFIGEILTYEGYVNTSFHTVASNDIPKYGKLLPRQERGERDDS